MNKLSLVRNHVIKDSGATKHRLRPGIGERVPMENSFPTTVAAAVRLLMSMVDESEQVKIAAMNVDDLSSLHFGLGMCPDGHPNSPACGHLKFPHP
jgi:hypothetical protein